MVSETRHGATFSVRVQPGAKRTALLGMHDGAYRIALQSPPVNGKANAALIAFLARVLNVPRSSVVLLGGEASRGKRIACASLPASDVQQRLATQLPAG